jgi:hypothetical protein
MRALLQCPNNLWGLQYSMTVFKTYRRKYSQLSTALKNGFKPTKLIAENHLVSKHNFSPTSDLF